MDNVAPQLPAVLGSTAGLIVAAVGLLVQLPPQTCALRAIAAFMVFTAFGIVIRFLLGDSPLVKDLNEPRGPTDGEVDIPPGTSVQDLLAVEEANHP